MANHLLVVSRCFVPRTTKAAHISTQHIKTFCVRFLGKYSMNQLGSKLILILVMFPSQWCHHNGCLCCSWCELKTKLCKKNVPCGKIMLPFFWELSFIRSRVKLGLSFDSVVTPTWRGQIEPSEVFLADDRCGRLIFSALVIVIPK